MGNGSRQIGKWLLQKLQLRRNFEALIGGAVYREMRTPEWLLNVQNSKCVGGIPTCAI